MSNRERKAVPGALVGRDIVKHFLKWDPIESRRAVRVEFVEHTQDALLTGRFLERGGVLYSTRNFHGRRGSILVDNQANPVG